jgi:hypothetical protein
MLPYTLKLSAAYGTVAFAAAVAGALGIAAAALTQRPQIWLNYRIMHALVALPCCTWRSSQPWVGMLG